MYFCPPTDSKPGSTMAVQFLLIRHGQSEANAGIVSVTAAQIPLTPLGHLQAQEIANTFAKCPGLKPDLIVVSPFLRARQTAKPTSDRFPTIPWEIWPVQEFSFINLQKYENTTKYDRQVWVNDFWQRCDPFYRDGDEAESFVDLIERLQGFSDRLKQQDNRSRDRLIVVFSHGQFSKAFLFFHLFGLLPVNCATMRKFWTFCTTATMRNGAMIKGKLYRDGGISFYI